MSRLQLLRISTVNLLVLALIVFCLKGCPPLAECVHLIKPGMSLEEVKRILGKPTHPASEGYELGMVVPVCDNSQEVTALQFQLMPVDHQLKSRLLPPLVEYQRGWPSYQFHLPVRCFSYPNAHLAGYPQSTFWLDQTHCLWLILDKQDKVIATELVAIKIEPGEFKEKLNWLWRKAQQIGGW